MANPTRRKLTKPPIPKFFSGYGLAKKDDMAMLAGLYGRQQRRNPGTMHVTEGGDLTSLHWLQDLSVVRLLPDPEGSSRSKGSKSGGLLRDQDAPPNIDYRKSTAKPPHSYATLICMAISANGNKITLARIYAWIRENFLYYRTAHPSWQVRDSFFIHFIWSCLKILQTIS